MVRLVRAPRVRHIRQSLDELVPSLAMPKRHCLRWLDGFGQDSLGVFGFNEAPEPELGSAPDSWLALGENGDITMVGMTNALAAFEAGEDLTINSPAGGLWYVLPGQGAGAPDIDGRVLLGQFASTGLVQVQLNLQYLVQSGEMIQAMEQWVEFPNLPSGCLDASACNYDSAAEVEDGSCEYTSCLGCTDDVACNYDASASAEDGSCTYPETGFDCAGNCLDDADGDGVCDADEITGCADSSASNYAPEATDDDGSCAYPGCTDPEASNYNAIYTEDDGSCLFPGCSDPNALNYDANANVEADCTYAAPGYAGLDWELNGEVEGVPSYRIYSKFTNPNDQLVAVFGSQYLPLEVSSTSLFVQHPDGGVLASEVSEALDGLDSWLTLGMLPGEDTGIQSVGLDAPGVSFEAGEALEVTSAAGGMWFVLPAENLDGSPGFPIDGRVLLGQLITDGQISLQLNLQYQSPAGDMVVVTDSLTFPTDGLLGCVDPVACNYLEEATLADDNCDYISCAGCLDVEACNYDSLLTLADTSLCLYPSTYYDCFGNCLNDSDGDDVCDELEVFGCTDAEAANFDSLATNDDGGCIYPGCTLIQALNFDPQANDDDGSCLVEGCTYSIASNYDPMATNDDGSCAFDCVICPEDLDDDGVCDLVDSCVGSLDVCGVCNGAGPIFECGCTDIPAGACDCEGNVLDALGVCGGDCLADLDADGICDEVDDCIGVFDECAVCNGPGAVYQCGCDNIPEGKCDCAGNTIDALGVCGGNCPSDINENGICDTTELGLCGAGTYWDVSTFQCVVEQIGCEADLNGDHLVAASDLLIFLAYFGVDCSQLD